MPGAAREAQTWASDWQTGVWVLASQRSRGFAGSWLVSGRFNQFGAGQRSGWDQGFQVPGGQ